MMRAMLMLVGLLLACPSALGAAIADLSPVGGTGDEYIYPESSGYSDADVKAEYYDRNDNFRADIQATGLKREFTYQVKLGGVPACLEEGGDDETNERIGYSGRWSCMNCDGSTSGNNRNDAEYEANKALPDDDPDKECIAGYLVFDYFVADSSGAAALEVETDASYHVLWCGPWPGSNYSLYSGYTPAGSYCTDGQYCAENNVVPEIERPAFNNLPEGVYSNVKITLTEESFHQDCGTWCTVLEGDLSFEIDHDTDLDNDGCINTIDPLPYSPSPDNDGDGYGADCDCLDSNGDVSPAGKETLNDQGTCSDGLDNDCDNAVDEQDSACYIPPPPPTTWAEGSIAGQASLPGVGSHGESRIWNRVLMLVLPIAMVLFLRTFKGRKE